MKLLYVSCHQVLEYDEVKLFHELGIDVFSTGTYAFPSFRPGMIRPGIDGLTHYPDLERSASTYLSSGSSLNQDLIDWADTIMFMHQPEALEKNIHKMKGKRVIFRSIGQEVAHQEQILKNMKNENGLEIVRYSPMEEKIPIYAGCDAMIRFYKDPNEYHGFSGEIRQVVNFTQSVAQRWRHTHFNEMQSILKGMPAKIYGTDNGDLGTYDGGAKTFDELKDIMRKSRVYLYGGTWPAPYTLSFIEAMMTGIPIVAMGRQIAESTNPASFEFYEIPSIIQNGVNGYVDDDINALRQAVDTLLSNQHLAIEMGAKGRSDAIALFGKETIANQWKEFLCR